MITSKYRTTAKKPPLTKLCVKCHRTVPVAKFFSNRDWIDQGGKDSWCKDCIAQCQTKDEMREYFWENNRAWNESMWANAIKQAGLQAANNAVFQKSSEDRQQVILESIACKIVPGMMQKTQIYKYEDHNGDVYANSYAEAKEAGKIIDISAAKPADPNVKIYSHEFNGMFKPAEIEYLETYYQGLENDFDLSDISLRDNAKKLAKASLLVDTAQDKYMSGKCSLQDVKDAIAQYDLLMKTGNFAACKRKPGDKGGVGSWSEIAFQLETTGHTMTRKIEWPKDDVDKTIEEFRYIVEALDLNGA